MDNAERLRASALFGGGAGAAAWLLHGVGVVLGIPRLILYVGAGTVIAYVIDIITSPPE